jgi:sialate O-acetylesterase
MRLLYAAALALCFSTLLHAEVRLPNAISDHAVLQRGGPIHLWGWATPGAHLTAHFHQQTLATEANALGKWSLYLNPEAAGGPYTLTITGDGPEKTVADLLVGDVWLASGQSNMEFPLAGFFNAVMNDSEKEIAAATNPKLRLLLITRKSSDFPLNDVDGTWTQCTPATAKEFSAVAYFFGREIAAHENVPIGLIDSTWGGTPADSWTSLDTLGSDPALLPAFASRATFAATIADSNAINAAETRENEEAKSSGKPAPKHPWHPDPTSWSPAGLYNGMIAPLTPMSLKGFLWYQGETNSAHDRAPYYGRLFNSMISDWRAHFAQGDLPFLYVQISSFNSPEEDWGTVRDQQRRSLAVANTAMAVTLDVGQFDNVHPPDKKTVAARLALAARTLVYGDRVNYLGPTLHQATPELQHDGSIAMRVWFDHAEGLDTHSKSLNSFELAGANHHFVPAQATIEGATVLVHAKSVTAPMYVRFGWQGYVADNLYNSDGLPASTFTSEEFFPR